MSKIHTSKHSNFRGFSFSVIIACTTREQVGFLRCCADVTSRTAAIFTWKNNELFTNTIQYSISILIYLLFIAVKWLIFGLYICSLCSLCGKVSQVKYQGNSVLSCVYFCDHKRKFELLKIVF